MINKEKYLRSTPQELNKTFLYQATKGKLNVIEYLLTEPRLDGKININYSDDGILGMTALMNAAYDGNLSLTKYLLTSPDIKNHADINKTSNTGATAFMYACMAGKINIVNFYLTNKDIADKIDINQPFFSGENAILLAAREGHLNIVKYLIMSDFREEINFNLKTSSEKCLLYFAFDVLPALKRRGFLVRAFYVQKGWSLL